MDNLPSQSTGKEYVPLCVYTHYSLQKAFSKPHQLVDACLKLGIKQIALTDINSVAGVVEAYKALSKKGIRLIYGMHLNRGNINLILLAKNLAGWKELLEVANLESLDGLSTYLNLSAILNLNVNGQLDCDALRDKASDLMVHFPNLRFGFSNRHSCREMIECVESWGESLLPLTDTYYCSPKDATKLQILICSLHKTNLKNYQKVLDASTLRFFSKDSFHLKGYDEMRADGFTDMELSHTVKFGDLHESFSLLRQPVLPKFTDNENEALRVECRKGWRELILPKFPDLSDPAQKTEYEKYVDRIKSELAIIEEVGFSGYFLIVQDFVNEARRRGDMIGYARGSGGGCLISYLIGNIRIDPVKYKLLFSRFINKGRISKENFSFPDLDIDFPRASRHKTIEYIKRRYGADRVAQISTFMSLQGKSALREVLRIRGVLDQSQINEITDHIPDKALLSDVLEEIRREGGVPSIIKWALEHKADCFTDYCRMLPDGTLEGELAEDFEIAIELEGTYKAYSKHASGVVISPEPLNQLCMLVPDKKNPKEKIAYFDMKVLEGIGLVKFDILGTAVLDKVMLFKSILANGDIYDGEVESEDDDDSEDV